MKDRAAPERHLDPGRHPPQMAGTQRMCCCGGSARRAPRCGTPPRSWAFWVAAPEAKVPAPAPVRAGVHGRGHASFLLMQVCKHLRAVNETGQLQNGNINANLACCGRGCCCRRCTACPGAERWAAVLAAAAWNCRSEGQGRLYRLNIAKPDAVSSFAASKFTRSLCCSSVTFDHLITQFGGVGEPAQACDDIRMDVSDAPTSHKSYCGQKAQSRGFVPELLQLLRAATLQPLLTLPALCIDRICQHCRVFNRAGRTQMCVTARIG